MKKATPDRNGYRVGPVVGSQFVHQVLDMKVHRGLRNAELVGDLFVAVTVPDQPQNVQFPASEVLFAHVLRDSCSNIRGDEPPAGMNRSNHCQHFSFRHALQNVGGCAGTQGPLYIAIAI